MADGAIASLDALPGIDEAVGDRLTVLFDSGVRTGAGIPKALALGAEAVLVARPYAYGLVWPGRPGSVTCSAASWPNWSSPCPLRTHEPPGAHRDVLIAGHRLILRLEAGQAWLEIVNDGAGRPGASGGSGLTGLGERLNVVGGEFRAGPGQGGTFQIGAAVPLLTEGVQ